MNPALDALCGPSGALHLEPPDRSEYEGLMHSGEARLADARRPENSIESRFDLAYNAAHALSLAALRRLGYRPGVDRRRFPRLSGATRAVCRVAAVRERLAAQLGAPLANDN